MADRQLTDFYEAKYAHEADQDETVVVDLVDAPMGRFEGGVAALAPLVAGKDVLELAAGSGTIAESLLRAGVAFSSWTLTEISTSRVEGMRRRLESDPRFEFAVVDAAQPTAALGDQRFDVIVSVALIEHLIEPISAMEDTRRLLRPGGAVYIDTPNIAKWTRRAKLAAGYFPATSTNREGLQAYDGGVPELHDGGHLHYFTFRSLERMLIERCGYSRVEPVPYAADARPTRRTSYRLAKAWPTMFADVSVLAYA